MTIVAREPPPVTFGMGRLARHAIACLLLGGCLCGSGRSSEVYRVTATRTLEDDCSGVILGDPIECPANCTGSVGSNGEGTGCSAGSPAYYGTYTATPSTGCCAELSVGDCESVSPRVGADAQCAAELHSSFSVNARFFRCMNVGADAGVTSCIDPDDDGEPCGDGFFDDRICAHGRCVERRCGDGLFGFDEECDDGNDIPDDGCERDCTYSCSLDTDCDDEEPCNGAERCGDHVCEAGTPLGDGAPCVRSDGANGVCATGACT
jgi:cysteine-rich repeat protein